MSDVLLGYSDDAKSHRSLRITKVKYQALIAFIHTVYETSRMPEDAARQAIRAHYASEIGPGWGAETNDWIRDSIIWLDLAPGVGEWWNTIWVRTEFAEAVGIAP